MGTERPSEPLLDARQLSESLARLRADINLARAQHNHAVIRSIQFGEAADRGSPAGSTDSPLRSSVDAGLVRDYSGAPSTLILLPDAIPARLSPDRHVRSRRVGEAEVDNGLVTDVVSFRHARCMPLRRWLCAAPRAVSVAACRTTGAESLVVETAVLAMLSLARKGLASEADDKALQHHAAATLATHDKLRGLFRASEHTAKVLVSVQCSAVPARVMP